MSESAQELLTYFRHLSQEHPEKDEWRLGAENTEKWIALMNGDIVEEESFADLLNLLESAHCPGSGWFDLWLRVRHWGYEQGFAVPDDHPWRIDTSVITCVGKAGFEGQVTIGRQYRLLQSRHTPSFVRVANDEGKHRWYPASHFITPETPTRSWIRKSEAKPAMEANGT